MNNNKKNLEDIEKKILLTEEEYEKIRRINTKEKMNRVLRVCGLVFAFMLVYCGLFDPLFELTYFGFLFDKEAHLAGWDSLSTLKIFDDVLEFGAWLPKLMFTLILIVSAIGVVYLAVYNLVDIINLIRNFYKSGIDITRDLTDVTKDSFSDVKKKKKELEEDKGIFEEAEKKEKKKKRETNIEPIEGYSSEELDILLSGGTLDKEKPEAKIEKIDENKDITDENEKKENVDDELMKSIDEIFKKE